LKFLNIQLGLRHSAATFGSRMALACVELVRNQRSMQVTQERTLKGCGYQFEIP